MEHIVAFFPIFSSYLCLLKMCAGFVFLTWIKLKVIMSILYLVNFKRLYIINLFYCWGCNVRTLLWDCVLFSFGEFWGLILNLRVSLLLLLFFLTFSFSIIPNQPVEVLPSVKTQELNTKYSQLTRSVLRILSNIYDGGFFCENS